MGVDGPVNSQRHDSKQLAFSDITANRTGLAAMAQVNLTFSVNRSIFGADLKWDVKHSPAYSSPFVGHIAGIPG